MSTYPVITPMSVSRTDIAGLVVITLKQVEDERGIVRELYRQSSWLEHGLPDLGPWLQMNATETKRGAIRGLHGEDMVKLVAVVEGEAYGAYLDTRPDSESYGRVVTVTLTKGTQVLVPHGVCNGFQATGVHGAQYLYAFDQEWVPGMAGVAVNPLDPDLGISWPLPVSEDDLSQVSAKDRAAPRLRELPAPPTP